MSGMCIQCAPRSNGTPKVAVSVTQRPPMRSLASSSAKRRPAAATLRAAAMPAAPAPTIATSTSPEAETRAERRRRRRARAEPAMKLRRLSDMVSKMFAARRNIARSNARTANRMANHAVIAYSFTATVNRIATARYLNLRPNETRVEPRAR